MEPNTADMAGPTAPTLADDLLMGVVAIAAELGERPRRTEYLLQRGLIPGRRVGRRWYSSRSALRAFFEQEQPAVTGPPRGKGRPGAGGGGSQEDDEASPHITPPPPRQADLAAELL